MMQIILNNPYRITDLLPTASVRDVHRQKQKVATFSKVGKALHAENDYPFFSARNWSSEEILKAFSDLEQNQNRAKFRSSSGCLHLL